MPNLIRSVISFEAETVQKTFVVPIEYRKLPENMVIEDVAPTEARVTLSGYERAFNLMVPSALKVSIDLSNVEEGQQQIVIEESHIKLPQNLTVFRALPRVLSFRIHRWVTSTVDVEGEAAVEALPSLGDLCKVFHQVRGLLLTAAKILKKIPFGAAKAAGDAILTLVAIADSVCPT